ncbi:MAG: J domain-containing protein [Synechococcales bacterium]|nr:J domain-containing protein [Synechococcales bacterium]
MAFKIERGLCKDEFIDHHAVLGISVEADAKDVRKRYLKIARRLHPDSSAIKTDEERQFANELLSKLVNPAYEKLSQEKEATEYGLLLKLKGQQANRQQDTILLTSDPSRQLAAASDLAGQYRSILKELTEQQYENLKQVLDLIGQISEVNLVYLMRREQAGGPPSRRPAADAPAAKQSPVSTASVPSTPQRPPKSSKEELVDAYRRRAHEHEQKGNHREAILELREALKIAPDSNDCHSQLGSIYLKSNQSTMAKIHFKKALDINPNDPIAASGMRRIDPKGAQAAQPSSQAKGKSEPSKGGLFGLFGGGKKK